MDLVERARAITFNPEATWATIEQESTDWQKLFVPYMVTLAIIPAFALFMAWSVMGVSGFGMSVRLPVATGLGMALSHYVMTLAMVFVWGWLLAQLAPTFGGQVNVMNGVKLTVYASTPAMLAGVFTAMPGLSILALVGSLYSLYLVYTGLPVLMKNPPEKSITYLVVATIVGIVCSLAISLATSVFTPAPGAPTAGMQGAPDMQINTPANQGQAPASAVAPAPTGNTTVIVKTPEGEAKVVAESLQDMAKRLQAMAQEQEKATKK